MKTASIFKKCLCAFFSVSVLLSFSACAQIRRGFTQTENGRNLISASGTEYSYLAGEGTLYYFGDLIYQGKVKGDKETLEDIWYSCQTGHKYGMFSLENDKDKNILIRRSANSEWFIIYRKASLPEFDFFLDNCTRLELVYEAEYLERDVFHTTCGDGITDKSEIAEFLSDVQSQPDPREVGLYDLLNNPDGTTGKCYLYAVIYGFFEDEPNIAIRMNIFSFNDLAYSVNIKGKEYVLPEEWIQRLQRKGDS